MRTVLGKSKQSGIITTPAVQAAREIENRSCLRGGRAITAKLVCGLLNLAPHIRMPRLQDRSSGTTRPRTLDRRRLDVVEMADLISRKGGWISARKSRHPILECRCYLEEEAHKSWTLSFGILGSPRGY
jgi:hypothetical protein